MSVYEGTILVGKLAFVGQKVELRFRGATYWLKDITAAISWLEINLKDMRFGD